MEPEKMFEKIECLLFVSGEPIPIPELARVFNCSVKDIKEVLSCMEEEYRSAGRGIQLLATEETVQLSSNKEYIGLVETLLQPERKRSASQSVLETLAVIAYRQPVTRADIESVRGVLCEYTLAQLQKMGLIMTVGHRDTPGKPNLYGTTDKFLRQFGLHSLEELPEFSRFSETAEFGNMDEPEDIPVV